MLKIHETFTPEGVLSTLHLAVENGTLALVADDRATPLSPDVLEAVMRRFGRALDDHESISTVATLELGDGASLRHVRHLARYDVIGRDYLVLELSGQEPLCALAVTVAGALAHLARAGHSG